MSREASAETTKRQYVHVPAEFAESTSKPINYSAASDHVGEKFNKLQQQELDNIKDTKEKKVYIYIWDGKYNICDGN